MAPQKPGANVEKYMRRSEQLRVAQSHVDNLKNIDCITKWSSSGLKQTQSAKLGREKLRAEEEVKQLNVELKIRRRAKLVDFYKQQEDLFEKELNDQGLAFVKARV